ncbi:MAG: hypothetical protein M0R39_09840 [Prolixibacteraceae bacterium]|nr:hypothetical protein [Prolixibacteraceae bacterium]
MRRTFKYLLGVIMVFSIHYSCTNTSYSLGDLTAPSNIVITADVVGATTASPSGDGSGDVKVNVTAKDALSIKVDYDANTPLDLVYLPTGSATKKYTTLGLNTYTITAVAYGKGGTSSTITKNVTVRSDFTVAPNIVSSLTNGTSKTWVVDKSVAGHFGVGPWSNSSFTPEWWAAGVNEKVACCNCFYSATFTFTKVAATGTYTLQVSSPDGVFTKTGSLTKLPGIPGSGGEACYSYSGGTSVFTFGPSTTGIPATAPSTKTAINVVGNTTFIGYGSLQSEYEILVITPTYMYLRAQGTETGNAWYLKLKPIN